VLGISPDHPGTLEGFAGDNQLGFPLLSDPDGAVAQAWGAWGPAQAQTGPDAGLRRSTVVLDEDGRVVLAEYEVAARGHVAALREQLLSV
jgi:peroxiredoxin Q/BCP